MEIEDKADIMLYGEVKKKSDEEVINYFTEMFGPLKLDELLENRI